MTTRQREGCDEADANPPDEAEDARDAGDGTPDGSRPPAAATYQVGPVYGVRDFLSSVRRDWDADLDDLLGLNAALRALKARHAPDATADAIEEGMRANGAHALMDLDRGGGARLGKRFVSLRGHLAARVETEQVRTKRREEMLILLRFSHRVERDRDAFQLSHANVMVARHALERLYEREGLPTGGVPRAIRSTMDDLRPDLAFALAAGLHAGTPPTLDVLDREEIAATVATTAVPFGTGLLVVETCLHLAHHMNDVNSRNEVRRSGIFAKGDPGRNAMTRRGSGPWRHMLGHVDHVGRTYLSRNILRPDQIRYLDAFRAVRAAVDADALARALFDGTDQHLGATARGAEALLPAEAEGVGELRRLLPSCVRGSEAPGQVWVLI